MFLRILDINSKMLVSEIVSADYRTAEVFRKHDIEYCCGGKFSLEVACMAKGVEVGTILHELNAAVRTVQLPGNFPFESWDTEFLIDYIVNVHHAYFLSMWTKLMPPLSKFIDEHRKKYPYLEELYDCVEKLHAGMTAMMEEEEKVTFPYIRQVHRAWKNQDSYARLLVKTLRKPIEKAGDKKHLSVIDHLCKCRELSNKYHPPPNSCINHYVMLSRLRDLDNELMQHLHLEKNILYPRAIAVEQEILGRA